MKEEKFSLEQKLKEIREIVDKMQASGPDFDENIVLFREGSTLIDSCRTYLDESELMLKKIIAGPDGELVEEEIDLEE